jgi:hypothetical protein
MAYYLFNEDLTHAVDLEVIKLRTTVLSETTRTREDVVKVSHMKSSQGMQIGISNVCCFLLLLSILLVHAEDGKFMTKGIGKDNTYRT